MYVHINIIMLHPIIISVRIPLGCRIVAIAVIHSIGDGKETTVSTSLLKLCPFHFEKQMASFRSDDSSSLHLH